MNLSNKDVDEIIENLIIHRTEINSLCGNIERANKSYDFAIRKICEIIRDKKIDLLIALLKNQDAVIVYVMLLFLLPISQRKAYKKIIRFIFSSNKSFDFKTLLREYKSGRLKYPKLIGDCIVYVSKNEYLEQFTNEEVKLISKVI